jgi:hypothetical protein
MIFYIWIQFYILGVQVSFVRSFISKVLQENLSMNISLPTLVDIDATFVMF